MKTLKASATRLYAHSSGPGNPHIQITDGKEYVVGIDIPEGTAQSVVDNGEGEYLDAVETKIIETESKEAGLDQKHQIHRKSKKNKK
jgi:hypothetical protein